MSERAVRAGGSLLRILESAHWGSSMHKQMVLSHLVHDKRAEWFRGDLSIDSADIRAAYLPDKLEQITRRRQSST